MFSQRCDVLAMAKLHYLRMWCCSNSQWRSLYCCALHWQQPLLWHSSMCSSLFFLSFWCFFWSPHMDMYRSWKNRYDLHCTSLVLLCYVKGWTLFPSLGRYCCRRGHCRYLPWAGTSGSFETKTRSRSSEYLRVSCAISSSQIRFETLCSALCFLLLKPIKAEVLWLQWCS